VWLGQSQHEKVVVTRRWQWQRSKDFYESVTYKHQHWPLDELFSTSIVDVFLLAVQIEHIVKRECFVLPNDYLRLTRSHKRADLTHVNTFLRQLWPYPNNRSQQTLFNTHKLAADCAAAFCNYRILNTENWELTYPQMACLITKLDCIWSIASDSIRLTTMDTSHQTVSDLAKVLTLQTTVARCDPIR